MTSDVPMTRIAPRDAEPGDAFATRSDARSAVVALRSDERGGASKPVAIGVHTRLRGRDDPPRSPAHRLPGTRGAQGWIIGWAGHKGRLIPIDDVLYFQSDAKYTRVVTGDAEVFIRKSLKELYAELDPDVFLYVHRSTLVNAFAIREIEKDERGRLTLHIRLRAQDRLQVSDKHVAIFRSA